MHIINPDISLIDFLRKDCKSAISTCMQCGSCSAVCDLSPEDNPFPRKEMIWASWGLKEKLVGDPDIWLCHQCGDCTTTCPRDVRPGDVIASLRSYHYLHYARPRFLARWLHSPKYLLLVSAIPVLIIAAIIALAGNLSIPEGPVDYSKFFPHMWLNGSFGLFVVILLAFLISGIRQFLKDMSKSSSFSPGYSQQPYSFWRSLIEILTHRNFRKCNTNRYRYFAHLLIFWGFIILLVVTLFAILSTLFFEYPLPFLNPIKIAGNMGGFMLLLGIIIIIIIRLFRREERLKTNYPDWWFLITLLLLTISGALVEMARFMNWSSAYIIYFIHLVLVWMVILYAPYTKFGHLIFRTLAVIVSKRKGRESHWIKF